MNSILLWLGIIVAFVLTAAFAAPFFIDWSDQRDFFEARASALLGKPVELAGPLEVRLVPFPSLTARDIRIGPESGDGGEGADAIVMRAALAPLLSGELRLSTLVLERPRVTIVIEEDGMPRLAAGSEEAGLPLSPERAQIERFEIRDGAVAVEDRRTGERHAFSHVNLSGSAATLAGPFRAEGGARSETTSYTISLATGQVQPDSSLRMTASIVPADRPLTVALDGIIRFGDSVPYYRGGLVLTRLGVEGSEGTAWQIRGDVAASPQEVVFESLAVRIGDEAQRVGLSGAARIQLGQRPHFNAVLSSRQMDFDGSFGGGPEEPVRPADVLGHLRTLLEPAIFPLPGDLAIDIDSLLVGGNLVEEVELDLTVGQGQWAIERARAHAPGLSDIGVSGIIDFTGTQPVFDGAVDLEAGQAATLAEWLFGPDARLPGLGAVAGQLDAAASLRMEPGAVEIGAFTIATSDAQMTGALSYFAGAEDRRPRLALQIETDRFEIDSLAGSSTTLVAMLTDAPSQMDLDLKLAANTLVAGAVEIADIHVDLMRSEDDLRVERLHVGDLGGGRLDGQGEIRGKAGAPEGSFTGEFEAQSLEGVSAILRTAGFGGAADRLSDRAEALAPARLSLSLNVAGNEDAGSRGQIALSGEAGGTLFEASLGFDGSLHAWPESEFDLSVEAVNSQPERLARQLGAAVEIGDEGDGRIEIAARGAPAAGLPFTASVAGIGIDGTAEGSARFGTEGGNEISAAFGFTVPQPGAVLRPAGIALPGGDASRIRIDGQLAAVDGVWRFSSLAINSGQEQTQGTLVVDFGGTVRTVDGSFQTGRMSLPWLLGAALGPSAIGTDASDEDEVWPRAPFSPVDRTGWQGRVGIEARQLEFGAGFVADDSSLTIGFDEERLSLGELSGRIFDGDIEGDIDLITTGGNLRLDGQFDLSQSRIEEFIWRADGRPVASGLVSAGLEIAGSGRSMLGLISTLSGNGAFRLEDGLIRRLNPNAFDRIVSAADAGLQLDETRVREVFAGHLDAGSFTFDSVEGSFDVASGVARTRNIRLGAGRLESFVSATVDLTSLGIDSEWSLAVAGDEQDSRAREVGIVFAGPLDSPSRMIDVSPLIGYLTVRAFEQDVERLERLQADILERERLGRELLRLGEERRRREREAQEAERQAAEEEARRAAEEEAGRDAEEAARRREEEEARRREEASRREEARRREEEARQRPRNTPSSSDGGAAGPGLENLELQRLIEDSLRRVRPEAGIGAPPYPSAPSEGTSGSGGANTAPPIAQPPRTAPLDIRPPASRS